MSLYHNLPRYAPRRAPEREFVPPVAGQLDTIGVFTLPFAIAVRLGVRVVGKVATTALDKAEHARYLRHANAQAAKTSAPSPSSLTSSAPLRREIARARRAFTDLLADYPSLARLQRRLETDLGILAARLYIDNFTSYRDHDGLRSTPPPTVLPPKWQSIQTLLDLPRLSQRTPSRHRRKR